METKPASLQDEHLEYLDELRMSGETNMYGARPYLLNAFPSLTKDPAGEILTYWMKTFCDRHPRSAA